MRINLDESQAGTVHLLNKGIVTAVSALIIWALWPWMARTMIPGLVENGWVAAKPPYLFWFVFEWIVEGTLGTFKSCPTNVRIIKFKEDE